jgi:hypothetical protein
MIAVCFSILVLLVAGCDSGYRVACVTDKECRIVATVKGPAAALALILADEHGKAISVNEISKEEMIVNSAERSFTTHDLQPGSYSVTVKTISPEKVVAEAKVPLHVDRMWVEDCVVDIDSNPVHRTKWLNKITLKVRKSGNMAVQFTQVSMNLDGSPCNYPFFDVMSGESHDVGLNPGFPPTPKSRAIEERSRQRVGLGLPALSVVFEPGDKAVLEGKLIYNGGEVPFKKEIVF